MRVLEAFAWIFALYFITIMFLLYHLYEQNSDAGGEVDKYIVTQNSSISLRKGDNAQLTDKAEQYEDQFRRYGPGENGEKVILPGINISLLNLVDRNKKHDFNTFISDVVSLHRKMPDMRPSDCKNVVYPENLPPITIVIIFRDEWWSILLRTVYSVLEVSPPHLIYEVIIVDDGSTSKELVTTIKLHAENLDKVRFIQNDVPLGLMMARQAGIDAVRSDMFVVMDGHMEVGPGWLEPLIYRLIQQPKALLCSHIGGIDQQTFEIKFNTNDPDDKHFDEQFPFFDHVNLDQMFATYKPEYRAKRNHSVEPIPYGTIQGMMMVMRKGFFQQLGGFDPGMKVWGSEQMELSVKVWMCGGVVEMVPCSTVAHMYRVTPWGGVKDTDDFHSLNKARMSKIWMDPPFSDLLSNFLSDKNVTLLDMMSRKDIRIRNHCKPYKYFIDKVQSFSNVYIPHEVKRYGIIQNKLFKQCIDIAKEDRITKLILYPCHKKVASNQYFILTESNQIRGYGGNLLDVNKQNDDVSITLKRSPAVWTSPETEWRFNGHTIVNVFTNLCLTALTQKSIGLKPCIGSQSQMWNWGDAVRSGKNNI